MGLKETKSKSFRLDQKIYNDYKNVFDKYNSETGNTNKQFFEEMINSWKLHKKNDLSKIDKSSISEEKISIEDINKDHLIVEAEITYEKDKKKIKLDEKAFEQIKKIKELVFIICSEKERKNIEENNAIFFFSKNKDHEPLKNKVTENFNIVLDNLYIKQKKAKGKKYTTKELYREVADNFGVEISTIENAKYGRTPITADNILAFENDYGVHRDLILGEYYVNPKNMYQIGGLSALYNTYKAYDDIRRKLSRCLIKISEKIEENPKNRDNFIEELEKFVESR